MSCLSQTSRYQLVLLLKLHAIIISMGSCQSREPTQRSSIKVWKPPRPLPTQMEPQNLGVLSLFCQTVLGVQVQPSSSSIILMCTLVRCRPSALLLFPTLSRIIWIRPREGSGMTTLPRSMELCRFRHPLTSEYA